MNNFSQDTVNVIPLIFCRENYGDERLGAGMILLFQKEANKEE